MDRYNRAMLTIIAASFAILAWRAADPPTVTVRVVPVGRVTVDGQLQIRSGDTWLNVRVAPEGRSHQVTVYD